MKNTVLSLMKMKESREKISMLTCYDYSTARLMESSGINMILVGDSLGNTMLGYPDTLSVTMEDMIHHGAAVVRGCNDIFVVVDMPFMSYQTSVRDAVLNAGRLMMEARGHAVKLEGGAAAADRIRAIADAGIPVQAHLGMTPQSVNALGVGPQGFGGQTTCLGLSIETAPTHVAGLPVAVNVSCHVTRRATEEL